LFCSIERGEEHKEEEKEKEKEEQQETLLNEQPYIIVNFVRGSERYLLNNK